MGRVLAIGAAVVAGCYTPSPPLGVTCGAGACPSPLVCSPATNTCEVTAVDIDAAVVDAAALDAPVVDAAPTDPVRALDGAQWLLPCGTHQGSGNLCACSNATKTIALTGDTTVYTATIHIRGVVETGAYGSGSGSTGWYVGGAPSGDSAGVFELTVSSPPQHYYLNQGSGSAAGALEQLDYLVSLPIAGDATVALLSNGQDGVQDENIGADGTPIVIQGVHTTPSPYDGEFAQLNVVHSTAGAGP